MSTSLRKIAEIWTKYFKFCPKQIDILECEDGESKSTSSMTKVYVTKYCVKEEGHCIL